MNEGDARLRACGGHIFRPERIDAVGGVLIRLCPVDRRVSRAIDHDTAFRNGALDCERLSDIAFRPSKRAMRDAFLARKGGERAADLSMCSKNRQLHLEPTASVAVRSPRAAGHACPVCEPS